MENINLLRKVGLWEEVGQTKWGASPQCVKAGGLSEALPFTGDMVVGEMASSRVLCREVMGYWQLEISKKENGWILEPGT